MSVRKASGITEFNNYPVAYTYPNPAHGRVNVQLADIHGNASYEVYNMTGQLQVTSQVTNGNNIIDISLLPTGMYITRLIDENRLVQKSKLQVQ
jgi:hypothetical protein